MLPREKSLPQANPRNKQICHQINLTRHSAAEPQKTALLRKQRAQSPWQRTATSCERLSSRLAPRRSPQKVDSLLSRPNTSQRTISNCGSTPNPTYRPGAGTALPSRQLPSRHTLPRRFRALRASTPLAPAYPLRTQTAEFTHRESIPPQATLASGAFPCRPRYCSGPKRVVAGSSRDETTHTFVMKEPTRDMIAMPNPPSRNGGLIFHSGENNNLSSQMTRTSSRLSEIVHVKSEGGGPFLDSLTQYMGASLPRCPDIGPWRDLGAGAGSSSTATCVSISFLE